MCNVFERWSELEVRLLALQLNCNQKGDLNLMVSFSSFN